MRTTAIIGFLVLMLGFSSQLQSQTPCIYLAEDIQLGAGVSNPTQFIEYGGNLYFSADDGVAGIELWMWDGVDAAMVEDIRPGSFGSGPKGFFIFSGDLYFVANDGVIGTELFVYDGSTVSIAADINPGAGHSYPAGLIAFPGGIYFSADNGVNGAELYVYDGSTASLVWDVNPGAAGSNIFEFEVFDTELCFTADNGSTGRELFSWDGASVSLLMDIRPGILGSEIENMLSFDGELVFRANDGSTGMEIWAYDGSSVYQLMDINPGVSNGNPWYLTLSGGYLYFRALDGVWGMELWRYDGTGLPYLLEDIYVGGPHPISSAPAYLKDVDGYLVFSASNGSDGQEIYRHDHTSYTTYDINPGFGGSDPQNFIGNGTDIFFSANDGATGVEIFQWDGASSLIQGEDLFPGATGSSPNNLILYGTDDIIFNADDGTVGNELWDWPFNIDVGSEIDEFSCSDYTAPSGAVYTTTGTYMDTIPSVAYPLCDSIITINLIVDNENPDFFYSSLDFCSNDIDEVPTVATPGGVFTASPGGLVFSSSTGEIFFDISDPGSYFIKYVTPGACPDSLTITINISPASDADFTYASPTFCLSQTNPFPLGVETAGGAWSGTPGGISVNPSTGEIDLSASSAGSYIIKHVTTGLCPDSLEFPVTLIAMTNGVTVSGNYFSADESGAFYQWMKCDEEFGYLPIWGATSQNYTPPTDGCYAVELTAGTCIDTSDCFCLVYYGLEENQLGINVDLYPNPVHKELQLMIDQYIDAEMIITDEIGRVVYEDVLSGNSASIDLSHLAPGVYLLLISNQEGAFIEKLIKE